jgi:hypothetical protein
MDTLMHPQAYAEVYPDEPVPRERASHKVLGVMAAGLICAAVAAGVGIHVYRVTQENVLTTTPTYSPAEPTIAMPPPVTETVPDADTKMAQDDLYLKLVTADGLWVINDRDHALEVPAQVCSYLGLHPGTTKQEAVAEIHSWWPGLPTQPVTLEMAAKIYDSSTRVYCPQLREGE